MVNYLKYIVFSLTFVFISSCAKINLKRTETEVFYSFNETIVFKKVEIIHPELKSKIIEFDSYLKLFEKGINTYSPYQLSYFTTARSFCRNDSSFLILKAKAGNQLIYNFSDEIIQEKIDQLSISSIDEIDLLIYGNIEKTFCTEFNNNFIEESNIEEKFGFDWYKKRNGERLMFVYPSIQSIYYINGNELIKTEFSFLEPLVKIN